MSSRVPSTAAITCLISLALVGAGHAGPRRSLVIALDGLRADGLISADTPNLDSLLHGSFGGGSYRGAFAYYAQTIQDAPTSSAYNHVSIMTGVTGAKHGVDANNAAAMAAVDYDAWPHYLTTLEQADPSLDTAYLVTWSDDLAIVSAADYIKDSSDALNVGRVIGILDESFADPAGDSGTDWPLGTEPDAIFLFLDDIDGAGHGQGFSPDEPGYIAEIEEVDSQLGEILAALVSRPRFSDEEWQLVIVSDHGGLGTGHGGLNPNSETIPFIVTSQFVEQGLLAGRVINYDTAPTAAAHMLGQAALPAHYDGVPQGGTLLPPPPATLSESLVVYLPFDGDWLDASGRGNHATVGAASDFDPTLGASGGLCGGYLEIDDHGGGEASSSYLTLGRVADLDFGADTDFTIATWYRVEGDQSGDPVIIGNKDWQSGLNTGTLLLANEDNGDDFGFNIAAGGFRRDIEPLDLSFGAWWFVAGTVVRDGNAVLVVISPDGTVFVLSDFADDIDDIDSPLPWNIGQDGTGSYPHNLDADLDELMIWRRALTLDELRQVHGGALSRCRTRLLRNAEIVTLGPVTPPLESILPLDPLDDLFLEPFAPGDEVPDDAGPLVFFGLDGPWTIRLASRPGAIIRIDF